MNAAPPDTPSVRRAGPWSAPASCGSDLRPLTSDLSAAPDLSGAINSAFAAARAIASQATDHARTAIEKAIECGGLLQQQRDALPHGAWLPWLAEHCPDISPETARRYMRLAKRSHETDLHAAPNLRQAYLATGVLPEQPREQAPAPSAPTITFTRGLDQFRRWFHKRTEQLPLDQWTPEARRLLRNELTWFRRLYEELEAPSPVES